MSLPSPLFDFALAECYLFLITLFRDKVCNTGEVTAEMFLLQVTLTWSKGLVRGLDHPVSNKAPSPPQRGSKASQDSTGGMRSLQPALPKGSCFHKIFQ